MTFTTRGAGGVPSVHVARPNDETTVAIVTAAQRLLADEGAEALTVRRLAQEAGLSTMNVYSRFGGKDGVVEALFVEGFHRLTAAMDADAPTDDPIDDLRRCHESYRRFAVENRTFYGVMFQKTPPLEPSPEAQEVAMNTLGLLAARVRRAMDAGVLTAGDPLEVAAALWGTGHGLVSLELDHIGPTVIDWRRVHAATIEALLRGLAAGPLH